MSIQAAPVFKELFAFFLLNPDEELRTADVCKKCTTSPQMARYTMQRMAGEGLLSMRKEDAGEGGHDQWIASAGPELLRMRGGR